MKRGDLMKRLAEIEPVELVRRGANHEVYRVNGNTVPVPRHNEIGEGLAATIIAQAEGRRKPT